MSTIATVTLNPAIDLTVRADNFRPGIVNRGQSLQYDAGGKGVNVASFLADYGVQTAVTGFLGLENVTIFEQLFAQKQIVDYFIRIPGQTRTGIKIVDGTKQVTTDINMPGLTPTQEELQLLLQSIEELAKDYDWFVLAGKVPPDVTSDIYATIIERLKKYEKRVVLDTSGSALRRGVQAGPTILKPNISELEEFLERRFSNEGELERAAQQLLTNGTEMVVVSMGQHGALFVNQDDTCIAIPPRIDVKSTVGAGDAMVAGLLAGITQGLNLTDCARLATAFSLGTITQIGPHLPSRDVIEDYTQQVSIRTPGKVILA